MKRILTFLFLNLMLLSGIFGQCEPDPAYTAPGIYPDSAAGFPPAVATYEYNLVITAVIPTDTLLPIFGRLNVDSIGVLNINGLPEGFQAIPDRPSGYWLGGTSGCMLITGTPISNQVGNYPLEINVVGFAGGLPLAFPFDINFYSITVLDSTAHGLPELARNAETRLIAYPNPFSGQINIEFNPDGPGIYECLIYDTRNRLLISQTFSAVAGKNLHSIDGSSLNPGIYFCVIRQKHHNISSSVKLVKY